MKYKYTSNDYDKLLGEINDYINQTESFAEREQYLKELNEVQGNFITLINSGVFHDAIGKIDKIYVEVVTDY